MAGGGELDSEERSRILKAAVEELAARGINGFDVEGVAARAGVPAVTVKQAWPNTPDLYSEAIITFARGVITMADTGTLRGDVMEYAKSYAAAMNSPIGRQLIGAVIVSPKDWDLTDARAEFLARRHERVTAMVQRGIDRGECSPDTNAGRFIDLLGGCLSMSVLYYGRSITEADCEEVVDMLLYGIVGKR